MIQWPQRGEIMLETRDLEAIRQILTMELEPIRHEVSGIKQDVAELKEDAKATRAAVNSIVEWTERVSEIVAVPFPVDMK